MRRADTSLTPAERTEYTSGCGPGQWLAGHTRPDIAAPLSLLQRATPHAVDLKAMYSILETVRGTPKTGATAHPLPLTDTGNKYRICTVA